MTKYTITSMREFVRFTAQGVSETVVHVDYTLPSRYVGSIELPKAKATAEEIQKRILAEIKPYMDLMGKTIETQGK